MITYTCHGEKSPCGHGYKVGPVVPPDTQFKPGDQVAVYYDLLRCYFTGTALMYPKDNARLAVHSTIFVHAIEVIKDDGGLDKWVTTEVLYNPLREVFSNGAQSERAGK